MTELLLFFVQKISTFFNRIMNSTIAITAAATVTAVGLAVYYQKRKAKAVHAVLPKTIAADGTELTMEVRTERRRRLAALRYVGAYSNVGTAFEKLMDWVNSTSLKGASIKRVGRYYDDPAKTKPENCRSDVCVEVPDEFELDEDAKKLGLKIITIRGGRTGVAVHKGPYEKLVDTYTAVFTKLVPGSGFSCGGYPYEVYLNSPHDTAPEKLRTELHVPLMSIPCAIL